MIDVLQELRARRLLSRLGQRLRPPIKRQSIQAWSVVPFRYLKQVATLTGIPPAQIRPDLNKELNLARALLWDPPQRHSEFWLGSPSATNTRPASAAKK